MSLPADSIEVPTTRHASRGDRRRTRQFLAGTSTSGALHATLLLAGALVVSGSLNLPFMLRMPEPTPTIVAAAREEEPIELTVVAEPRGEIDRLLAEHVAEASDWDYGWIEQALARPPENAPLPTDELAAKWVAQASERSQARSADENLRALDELGDTLSGISSETSVGEIGGVLGRALGLDERATAPIEGLPERAFDFASAQLHDVELETDEGGVERYVATLVDRHGTALRQEMDAANGKQAYDTMRTIEQFPLLESVYRSLVMKILDRLIEAEESLPSGS